MSETKTNVCRILDKSKIHYECHSYEPGEKLDAVTAAQKMGLDPGQVFKTLVTQGKSGAYHVFVIPGAQELDLKSGKSRWGKVCGNDPCQGYQQGYRVHSRRLQPHRNEKTIRNHS